MHTHTARTTLDKLAGELDALMPPSDHDGGIALAARDGDLVDLKVEYLGGRDVLAIAVHHDHDVVASEVRLVRVEEYGPEFRVEDRRADGAVMTPDVAGLVEDVRRTWALWYGQNGRPTLLWLYRDPDGGVIGDPIDLDRPVPSGPVGPVARTVTIRRKDNGWDQFAFVNDDGQQVACFTVDPRHVTLVHDRPSPPEWIGHGLAEEVDGGTNRAPLDLVRWFEEHPDLIGEGSAVENAIRLLDHAYNPDGCDDPRYLSSKTPGRPRFAE